MKLSILIVNGPNLNLLGTREPSTYGNISFEKYLDGLRQRYADIQMDYVQSNVEGEIINFLHQTNTKTYVGVILNAGAYTHTSIAIGDAVAAISTPVVEVHISNIFQRESFRHVSHLSAKCIGSIAGFGLYSYDLAVEALKERARKEKA